MFHVRQRLLLPALEVTGYVCRTHKTSQTAFRGFGGPQGMLVIEDILDRIARTLGLPPEVVRERNFYREGDSDALRPAGEGRGAHRTHLDELKQTSDFAARRASSRRVQRGRTRTASAASRSRR